MFKNIFKKQINSITVAAALVAISSLASRVLGVLRDRILAGQFGAGRELDIYYAAFKIPDLVYNLIILGALSAGFIPIFTSLIKNFKCERTDNCDPKTENKDAWNLASNIFTILFIGLAVLSFLGIIFAPFLMRFIAPGFSEADKTLTASLTRIMFLSPLFLGISGIFGGILQSFKRFFVYSIAPIFYNLGIILGAIYLVGPWGLTGLAWGVVFGAILHLAVQIPTVYSLGFRYCFRLAWDDINMRQIFRMMVPRTMSLAISQLNLVVITALASGLTSGSLAIFNFANNLQSFPIGIFGVSFAIAAFPALSEAAHDKKRLAASFSQAFRQILFFIVPATVLIIILRAQIIRVILGTGNFDWQDTVLTMNTLGFFALSLFAQATVPLLVRVFYARHNSKTPFYLGLITVAINIILSLLLAPKMGVAGLALAFSIAGIVNFLLLFIWIYLETKIINISQILFSVLKFTIAAIFAGLAAQVTKSLVWPFIDMTKFSGVFIQLISAGAAALLVYGFLCYAFKSDELLGFLNSLKNRWPFKKVRIDDQGEARGV
jgi:putative peptidoglycan lipid II flippase